LRARILNTRRCRYPAGHVYIHQVLHDFTAGGLNLARAQQIYGALYIASLVFVCAAYRQAGGVPNWVLLLLPLSKRLHSIYVLRLFNDCWAAVAVHAAIWAYGRPGGDTLGTLMFR
jgi:alpha-1,3-mannosyltransferase